MGCQRWNLSGGEPMLRPDFAEIFTYITDKAVTYTINTNGTLITAAIARLLRRRGNKMVALYGATPAVHDHVTRRPGSFEETMRGFAHLQEAGAEFTVQLVPLRDNYHQLDDMVKLAQSLSPHYRVGAAWLYLSACGSRRRNAAIARQRLDPKEVIQVDRPDLFYEDRHENQEEAACHPTAGIDFLFSRCIATRKAFHVDPYGRMTFCPFVKDPSLRYDLLSGNFQEAWDEFIPSLAERVRGGSEYLENCAVCELRGDCRWCGVYAFLEHGRHGAKVDYLCRMAREKRAFKQYWRQQHCRYYEVGGITVQVQSDLPITDHTFFDKLRQFEVKEPGRDLITIRHYFSLPDLKGTDLGQEVYRAPPWAVFRREAAWIYLGISTEADNPSLHKVAIFNQDHTRGRIYSDGEDLFLKGDLHALTLFPTDQILLARVLADRHGCLLHSSAVIMAGQGLLFVGHSEAGKSTIVKMLRGKGEILCDDRNIVRRWPEGFRVHGTWSHGEVPLVSPASGPLKAICFLHKSNRDHLGPLRDRKKIMGNLLSCLIRPVLSADWWDKMLPLVGALVREVPCYTMEFSQSGKIVAELEKLVGRPVSRDKS
jgi:MoaA/NifB/PqqE/SkfB family radical SAM enzyme